MRSNEALHVPMVPGECTVWREIEGGYGVGAERTDNVFRRTIYRDGSESFMTMDFR